MPYRVSGGVGIVTITGSLVNCGAWVGAHSGLTSYEGIGHQIRTVAADDNVHAVILDLHSPGGEAVGAFEMAALVRDLAAKKRTIAIVNGTAASAVYAIASRANEIVMTQTGVSGSIGVALLHADFSRQLDREGITPTLIHAGAHKVDGNPFEPLSDDVRDDLQAEVNGFYDAFLATVATGRGKRLTAAAARKTEARTFIGAAAVAAGLADRVGTFEAVLAGLSRARGGRSTIQTRRPSMDTTEQAVAEAIAGISQADHDAAVAAAHADGRAAGATAANEPRRARKEAARFMHGRGHKQARAHLRFMRTRLGRLIRDIECKIADDSVRMKAIENVLERARTIHGQQPADTPKLYAFHTPEVECIGKGKARTRYEFGVKASLATTNERCKGGQFVLGAMSLPGNPYDGHTLGSQLDQVARVTGRRPPALMSTVAIAVMGSIATGWRSMSPTRAALSRPPSGASCGDETPSSWSSAT